MDERARRLLGPVAALISAALAIGACTKPAEPETYAPPPPPPPAPEQPQLAGAPTAESQAQAVEAVRQAREDTYLATLPASLIVTRREEGGRTILVISNRPIDNPAWRARPHHARLSGGPRTETPKVEPQPTLPTPAARQASEPSPSAPPVQTAPSQPALASAAQSLPTAPATKPAASSTAPAFKGLTLSPLLWVVLGVILLAIVLFSIFSGQRRRRRSSGEAHA